MTRAEPIRSARRAFTLIELLVVITIITILAGLALVALFAAQEKAKEAQTKAVITKLNAIVMAKYDSYQTRRVPTKTPIFSRDREEAAQKQLMALRELMKIEMPDRYTDITDEPKLVIRTGQSESFKSIVNDSKNSTNYEGAECLYLMVMANTADGPMRGHFSDRDIGDRDNDGMPEFRDGWNNPISFLRWPAGFDSQLQRVNDTTYREKNPDPFDPLNVHKDVFGPSWAIYPLIASPGPDGALDIKTKLTSGGIPFQVNGGNINPYENTGGSLFGTAMDVDDPPNGEEFYDNITNHSIQTSSQQ